MVVISERGSDIHRNLPTNFSTIEDSRNPVMGAFKGGDPDIVGSRPTQIRKGKKMYFFNFLNLISNFYSWMTGHTFAESKLF